MGGSVLGLYTPLRLTPARIPLVSAHIPLRFKAGSNERRVELANLCTGTALQGMPNSLRVAPGPPGDRSLVSGIGLSLASIGRLATLTVYARDRFGTCRLNRAPGHVRGHDPKDRSTTRHPGGRGNSLWQEDTD